jgi:hypothetical protein
MSEQRKRLLLIGTFIIALLITLFFGVRLVRRILYRPTREPIRAWMNIGYVARAYGLPPQVLEEALGLPPGPPPDRRPLSEIAKAQNRTTDEVIQILEKAIAQARPPDHHPPRPTKTTNK